ncbi:MAG: endolytic transglycosylase MltG [Tannerella sp.]|jgi:UPF0755 protein|nr:endolytic transglycosylase MltG [Tannerella sp.]
MKKVLKRRLIIIIIISFVAICAIIGGYGYYLFLSPNFAATKVTYIYIYPDKDFNDVCRQLTDSAKCLNINSFKEVAKLLKYPGNIKTGRYAVKQGMNNYDLVINLRRGQQEPVRITFNNIRLKEDLAERLSAQLMISKQDINDLLNDPSYCESIGFDTTTIMALFIPNTYEVYWNISTEKLFERMQREYNAFWTDERRNRAQQLRLSPIEVSILASIVEEESAVTDEYPTIAGLYINRLHRGIPLQADPTIKYALGDFTLQRILLEHLNIDSPYNTYLHTGLPPGPLRIPSPKTLDAVLNYSKHNYLYMCAKEDFSGRHNFAVTLAEHNRNADRYQAELNRRGIR